MNGTPPPSKGTRIAVSGKGGSGKTLLTATLARLLAGELKLLAIDADSAVNLPYALGVEIPRSVSEIRREIIEDPQARARIEERHIATVMGDALTEGDGFELLVMGRPEGPGCYCSINELLRYGIDYLAGRFDLTLVDGEAGPEQVSRRVLKEVDVLVIVTDATQRGLRVAGSIAEAALADEESRPRRMRLVVNRLGAGNESFVDSARSLGLGIWGCIPEDESVREFDRLGKPIVDLPRTSPSVAAIAEIAERVIASLRDRQP